MIAYSIIDENGNETLLSTLGISLENNTFANTFTKLDDVLEVEVETIEKSFTPGADFPGIKRDRSKNITYTYDLHFISDANYRIAQNSILKIFRNGKQLRNITYNIATDIEMLSHQVTFMQGTENQFANCSVTFKQLIPYWESYEYTTVTADSGEDTIFSITNNGYIETPPTITMDANAGTSKVLIKVTESNEGIFINDLQFGVGGLNQMILDNKNGTLKLDGLDRRNKIAPGTGFFTLQPGVNTVTFDTNGNIDIEIKYAERYYI